MDYTEDKTDENKEYPHSDAVSANKKLCPTLVEIVKHAVFDYAEEDRHFKTRTRTTKTMQFIRT